MVQIGLINFNMTKLGNLDKSHMAMDGPGDCYAQ